MIGVMRDLGMRYSEVLSYGYAVKVFWLGLERVSGTFEPWVTGCGPMPYVCIPETMLPRVWY